MSIFELLPPFDWETFVVAPWTTLFSDYAPILAMGFFVITACGWVGTFLVWRRMALVGDAISHSVLPGIVIAYLFSGTLGTLPLFAGAMAAGLAATVLIEVIHRRSRVKVDAALGIVFTTLFASGVILIALFADHVDLDTDCVLYGEIAFLPLHLPVRVLGVPLGPPELVRMGAVTLAIGLLIVAFFKELQLTAFDPGLAQSLGISPKVAHYGLMMAVSLTVVSAFESVGSILVIAMLILPGVTASLLSDRLRVILALVVPQAAVSSVLGLHLALWLNASIAACMVVAATGLFLLAWIASPTRGLFMQWRRRRRQQAERLRTAAANAPA